MWRWFRCRGFAWVRFDVGVPVGPLVVVVEPAVDDVSVAVGREDLAAMSRQRRVRDLFRFHGVPRGPEIVRVPPLVPDLAPVVEHEELFVVRALRCHGTVDHHHPSRQTMRFGCAPTTVADEIEPPTDQLTVASYDEQLDVTIIHQRRPHPAQRPAEGPIELVGRVLLRFFVGDERRHLDLAQVMDVVYQGENAHDGGRGSVS